MIVEYPNDLNSLGKIEVSLNVIKINSLKRSRIEADVFTIDPSGCTDADDAFSIWEQDGHVHLMIHIADPTEFIEPHSNLFYHIIKTAQTHYPFGEPPIHLFPDEILSRASLMNGSHKNAISVHAIFEQCFTVNKKWRLISSNIEFCLVNCDTGSRFTYESAAEVMLSNPVFMLGTDIATQLWKDRSKHMSWMNSDGDLTLFNDMNLTIPLPSADGVILKPDTPRVKVMKAMIAEFAILANTVFAKGLSDRNIFLRSAQLTDEIKTSSGLSGQNLLHKIIEQSVSASYINEAIPHDIVTGDLYTHSTSPLRRASDCIVHMLLKAQALGIDAPFTKDQLHEWSIHLTSAAKQFKKEQYAGIKQATLRWISEHLPVNAKVKAMSYKAGFLNLMITELNSMPVNISYTLKRKAMKADYNTTVFDITLNSVHFNAKYDEGTLKDIDAVFI